jgi:hypothetical protein
MMPPTTACVAMAVSSHVSHGSASQSILPAAVSPDAPTVPAPSCTPRRRGACAPVARAPYESPRGHGSRAARTAPPDAERPRLGGGVGGPVKNC